MSISSYYVKFVKNILDTNDVTNQCIELISIAFKLSTHLVRVRSVAKAAGFCAFYGRMAEKMGVYEVLEYGSVAKGREVHRVLGLASFNLFMENPIASRDYIKEKAKKYVEDAVEDLKDFLDVDNNVIEVATHLLKRLGEALPRAKRLLGLNQDDPLFPIVEQTLADYRTRMYGAPDLILENTEKGKAIVVEWKTYRPGERRSYGTDDFEIAQVIAYSILEAVRLGIKINRKKDILESITGIRIEIIENMYKSGKGSQRYIIDVDSLRSAGLLRVLPLIVTPSGGFPPHPFMYKRISNDDTRKRFVKLYKLFRGVIVAAEHLALQIMNIPKLLNAVLNTTNEDLNTIIKSCVTEEGYPVYSYTPFRYLKAGKPGNWDSYPCIRCTFRGDGGPCDFYFGGKRPKDYFDKLMWWARYKVYWERELDLVSHKVMYELFRNPITRTSVVFSDKPVVIEVNIDSPRNFRILKRGSIVYLVRVKRGLEELGKFRFDYFKVSDMELDEDNGIIELARNLRSTEVEAKGFLRRSVYLAIIDPSTWTNPLLSINTFVMIDDVQINGDKIVYRCYNPSPALQYKFKMFGKYLKWYKQRNRDALILAYETPVDLTIMELRAIDALHRYLKQVADNATEVLNILKQHGVYGVEEEDLINEANTIRNYIPEGVKTAVHVLYNLLRKKVAL